MPLVTVIYGEETREVNVSEGSLLGDAIVQTGLPLEQPCAGRGTCGKCKVIDEEGLGPPDDIELEHLTPGELAVSNRLACRAKIEADTRVILAPIVVYSNKIFRGSSRFKREINAPLGLAIDLGSTTVAAFLTMLADGEVCAGAASLNQQTVYGADVISRMAAAIDNPEHAIRLHKLAVASINQAIDSLKLSKRVWDRIQKVTIVGNPVMHHLLTQLPVSTLAVMPFQPFSVEAISDASDLLENIFSPRVKVSLPPLIGGFVGSDALACLAYFDFENTDKPMVAVDLGTNGEVMVTDGEKILVASTAAGPAFEGVNVSCGSRAVDGAITSVRINNNTIDLETIAGLPPIGLTGSGLISAVKEFVTAKMIETNGRINQQPPIFQERILKTRRGSPAISLTDDGRLTLNQFDIRELQKGKGAIRAAIDVLMAQLNLRPTDIDRMILTGSFGGQVDIESVISLGMIPPIPNERVETIANGAGLGGAMFLSEAGFALGEKITATAQQVDLDRSPNFYDTYIGAMSFGIG